MGMGEMYVEALVVASTGSGARAWARCMGVRSTEVVVVESVGSAWPLACTPPKEWMSAAFILGMDVLTTGENWPSVSLADGDKTANTNSWELPAPTTTTPPVPAPTRTASSPP